mmetsp:Transcript_3396/g.8424  ORF Transcript_3396/g.8424 Transcript_3396/m.8424 type:complete len:185 (+) Transcript_3396:331-885(+)
MYSKMIGSTLALGLCLLGSSVQVRAQAAESAADEWFPSPKVALLNCGANAMAVSGGYLNETDGTLSTVGWFEVPAGANSGGLPMPSDKFFVRIESEDPATEADSDTLVVTFPDIPTRELCARVPGSSFNIGESYDGAKSNALSFLPLLFVPAFVSRSQEEPSRRFWLWRSLPRERAHASTPLRM